MRLTMTSPQLKIRLQYQGQVILGPGKLALLLEIDRLGSISAAAKAMHMSYRRAWELVDVMNQHFDQPVVSRNIGGLAGGGAAVTDFGRQLIQGYQQLCARAEQAAQEELSAVFSHLKTAS